MGVNTTEYVMSLIPDSGLSREQVIEKLDNAVEDLVGLETEVEQPIAHLISHMLSGVTAQIAIKVFGDDLRQLEMVAHRSKLKWNSSMESHHPLWNSSPTFPQVQIRLKRNQLATYGVTAAYIHEMIETALNGRVVSTVLDGQRTFDLMVRFDDEFRSDFYQLERTPIELPDGARVPLSELADIREALGPNKVKREDARAQNCCASQHAGSRPAVGRR